jgi:hypothetical protein
MKKVIIIWLMVVGVSGYAGAQDSAEAAAALKHFMTASGGGGMLYQYQTRYDVQIRGTNRAMIDTMSSAISDDRYTRVDMGVWGMRMSVLGRTSLRGYNVFLHPETKTYNLNVIDTARRNHAGGQTFGVTKVGTEMVAGYPCIHAKMTVIGEDKKEVMNDDVWTSVAVPGYAQMKRDMANQHITAGMLEALDKAGCDGFVVKMSGQGPMSSNASQSKFEMILIKAERKNFPASLFEIPAGYRESSIAGFVK